jgi:SDR family mycofactocin-dependent oxidoreductase
VPVALITGAARGIGAASARALSAAGWSLVLVDRCADDPDLAYPLATPADLDAVVAACDEAVGVVGDVRSPADLASAVALARERFGGLDAAVASAGVIAGGTAAWDAPPTVWETQVGVNLTGVWNLAVATIPELLARTEPRQGRFVAVASAAGLIGNERLAAYNATKAGVLGLVRGLAADLAGTGVTANAVCPGSTRGPILDASAAIYDLDSAEDFAIHHLHRRLLEPDEVAAAIAFLCSPAASGLTGATVPVDAGMTT